MHKVYAMGQADIVGAGRDEAPVNAVMTEVAFVGDPLLVVI